MWILIKSQITHGLITRNNTSNSGQPWMMDKCGPPRSPPIEVLIVTEVWILQGICPLKDEWVFGCSLKTRLADQTKDSTTEVVMVK